MFILLERKEGYEKQKMKELSVKLGVEEVRGWRLGYVKWEQVP